MLDKVLKVLIYSTVFLVPVFFLPFTFDVLEFNKLYLLFFLVWLSVLVWFLKMIVEDKEVKIRHSIIDYLVLAFVGISVLSSIFSIDKLSSLFGYYGRFSTGIVGLITLGAFYFLVANNLGIKNRGTEIKNKKSGEGIITVDGAIKTLLCSGFVVLFFSYFSLFGIWAKLAQLGGGMSLIISKIALRVSPVGGTIQSAAMFLVPMVILAVLMCLGGLQWGGFYSSSFAANSQKRREKVWKIFAGLFVFLAYIILIVADIVSVWIILSLGLLAIVIMVLRKRILKEEVHKLILPIALIIISVLFMILNFRVLAAGLITKNANLYYNFMQERTLTQGESWGISGRTVFGGLKTAAIGSGPGTFYYDFSKFRPSSLNMGSLWAIRFDRSGSAVSEVLATTGILGLLSFLLLIGGIFLAPLDAWTRFRKKKAKESQKKKLGYGSLLLMIILAVLVLIQFIYYQTITLAFLFWLFLGLFMGWMAIEEPKKEKEIMERRIVKTESFRLKDFVEMTLVIETVLIVLFLGFVILCFFGLKFYLADAKYVEALSKTNLDDKVANLQEAIRLNPHQVRYQIVLSRVFLAKAQKGLADLPEGGDQREIVQNVNLARAFAMNATQITPQQIMAWQSLADIYQNTVTMAKEGKQFAGLAIDALKKAIELEPKNPQFYSEMGNMYLLLGQKEEAQKKFEEAIQQKSDYVPANISLALLLEKDGKIDEAISKLEWLQARNLNSPDVLFQLGRLYYNKGETDKAINQFLSALRINPRHSNSLYSLGIAYEKQGKKKEAIAAFEAVLKLNPGLEGVQQKIDKLKKENI